MIQGKPERRPKKTASLRFSFSGEDLGPENPIVLEINKFDKLNVNIRRQDNHIQFFGDFFYLDIYDHLPKELLDFLEKKNPDEITLNVIHVRIDNFLPSIQKQSDFYYDFYNVKVFGHLEEYNGNTFEIRLHSKSVSSLSLVLRLCVPGLFKEINLLKKNQDFHFFKKFFIKLFLKMS